MLLSPPVNCRLSASSQRLFLCLQGCESTPMNHETYTIRHLDKRDLTDILSIIYEVRTEFELAERVETVLEPADTVMFSHYQHPGAAYFVVSMGARVVGGAGIARLAGVRPEICELQRMYLRPNHRKRGLGQRLLNSCLIESTRLGYQYCYAETVAEMTDAIRLYRNNGFVELQSPMGDSGHVHNDRWLILSLEKWSSVAARQ